MTKAKELAENLNKRVRRSAAERLAELDRQREEIVQVARKKLVRDLCQIDLRFTKMLKLAEAMPEIGCGEVLEMLRALRLHTAETIESLEEGVDDEVGVEEAGSGEAAVASA